MEYIYECGSRRGYLGVFQWIRRKGERNRSGEAGWDNLRISLRGSRAILEGRSVRRYRRKVYLTLKMVIRYLDSLWAGLSWTLEWKIGSVDGPRIGCIDVFPIADRLADD